MKILWFSNTPAGAQELLEPEATRGGWMISLEKNIKNKVKLSVAFNYSRFIETFEFNGVTYFPICRKNWKYNIIKKQIFGKYTHKEDLPLYLEIIDKIQPDLIHIFGTENAFSCLVSKTNIPIVISIQGNYTVYTHKYYSGIEKEFAYKRHIDIWSPYSWIFSKSWNKLYKIISIPQTKREITDLKNCKNIIGRTDWDRRITRILAPDSRYFHNDEVLRDSFYHNKWELHDHARIIIHTTTGEAIFKGFETVCQALNELNKINIDIEWRVAGLSNGCLLDKIVKKKLKEAYPLRGLLLLGNLKERELLKRMLEADIFVLPSHIDNSPNSLCEAMILGMPCITTHSGGSSSLLRDKEEGLVIQDGDPWSMAGAILELNSDKDKAIEYGQKARQRALIRHNHEKIVKELLEIYAGVLNY